MVKYDPKQGKLCSFYDALPKFLSGNDNPRFFLERCLEIISEKEPHVQAFVTMDQEKARILADLSTQRYSAGHPLSPVDGMPFAVKDLFQTADFPTELNSPLLKGTRHKFDAACVYALKKNGAILIGKTTLPELGSGTPASTKNPFDLARSPGGSSSGTAAAIGAGMLPLAIGNQGRGSILRPASFCGNFALKPTFGALHSGGMLWRSPSYSVLGIHSSNLIDCWRSAYQIAETVGGDPGYPGLYGEPNLKIEKPNQLIRLETAGWATTEKPIKKKFETFIQRLRENGVKILSRYNNKEIDNFESLLTTIPDFQSRLSAWEIQWPALLLRDKGGNQIERELKARFEIAESMSLNDYRETLSSLQEIREAFDKLNGLSDGFITLSTPTRAPLGDNTGSSVFGDPSSCLEAPAWNLPLLEDRGLPMGIQLLGSKHHDYTLGNIGLWMTKKLLAKEKE